MSESELREHTEGNKQRKSEKKKFGNEKTIKISMQNFNKLVCLLCC